MHITGASGSFKRKPYLWILFAAACGFAAPKGRFPTSFVRRMIPVDVRIFEIVSGFLPVRAARSLRSPRLEFAESGAFRKVTGRSPEVPAKLLKYKQEIALNDDAFSRQGSQPKCIVCTPVS